MYHKSLHVTPAQHPPTSILATHRLVQSQGVLVPPLQQRHAKGVAQPVARFAHADGGRRLRHVRFGHHAQAPALRAPLANDHAAVAAVTARRTTASAAADGDGAQHAVVRGSTRREEFGGRVGLAKLAGFAFGGKGALQVLDFGGASGGPAAHGWTHNRGNELARRETAMDRPGMQCAFNDHGHAAHVKIRHDPGSLGWWRGCGRAHAGQHCLLLFFSFLFHNSMPRASSFVSGRVR